MKIGVLGGGQLGWMMALAGAPLDLRFRLLDPNPNASAGRVAELVVAEYDDESALEGFVDGLDVVTYEFENVPARTAAFLAERLPVHPDPKALHAAQDRLREKELFRSLGLDTAPFRTVDTREDLDAAIDEIGLPAVLKRRRFGYDGKGQEVLREAADADPAWESLGGKPLLLEGFVPYDRELSILSVRATDGTIGFYPLVENHHHEGILRLSLAPAPSVSPALQARAEAHATRVLEALDYVGVLAIELFQRGDDLLGNEMAPRVHNSGHWSIEGAETSQFENHVRAVAGLPLGSTATIRPSAMMNLIGRMPDRERILRLPGVHLHHYGKKSRPGRKLGHVTVCAESLEEARAAVEELGEEALFLG